MPRLFLDMDGVLADFDQHYENLFGERPDKTRDNVDWVAVRGTPNFYANIPPMADMPELWDFCRPYSPTVLTGVPKSVKGAGGDKIGWVKKNLGPWVPVITCPSREKSRYAKPGDILVDDWEKYKALWVKVGGVLVTHTSATSSIARLKELGFGSEANPARAA